MLDSCSYEQVAIHIRSPISSAFFALADGWVQLCSMSVKYLDGMISKALVQFTIGLESLCRQHSGYGQQKFSVMVIVRRGKHGRLRVPQREYRARAFYNLSQLLSRFLVSALHSRDFFVQPRSPRFLLFHRLRS